MKYAFLFMLFYSTQIYASPAEEPQEHKIPIIDSFQEFFGEKVNHVANDFDSFFGTERADDELGRSRFRIRKQYSIRERAKPDDDTQIRFNLRLPQLENRFKSMIENKKPKNKAETLADKKERAEKLTQANTLDTKWLFRGDTSVNASIHPSVTVRGRLRKSKQTGTLVHRFVQEATWISTRDGFRNRTTLTSDHTINDNFLFRFGNNVDWKISKKNFTTGHGPGILQRLGDNDALSYGIGFGTTVIDKAWFVSNYQIATTYRHNIYHNVLYFDATTGLDFPKEWSFRRTPFIFFQVEALFGG